MKSSEGLRKYELTHENEEVGVWDDEDDVAETKIDKESAVAVSPKALDSMQDSASAAGDATRLRRIAKLAFYLGYWKCRTELARAAALNKPEVAAGGADQGKEEAATVPTAQETPATTEDNTAEAAAVSHPDGPRKETSGAGDPSEHENGSDGESEDWGDWA